MYISPKKVNTKISSPTKIDMNNDENFELNQINKFLDESKKIAIIPSKTAEADSFCASVGLYYMLKEKFELENKEQEVKLIYSGGIPEKAQGIIKEEEMVTNLHERDLLITIDYSGTEATKIQYNNDKENENFYFKLGPVSKNFDTSRIKAKITGFDFDLMIIVGAQQLADLGPIYNRLRNEINMTKKINLDITQRNERFGVVNLLDETADSLSMLVYKNACKWGLEPTKKAAKAMLVGMTYRDPRI